MTSLVLLTVLAAGPQLLDVRKVGDTAAHNAFTDLVKWRGAWWLVYREASRHVSPDGAVRLLRSKDGVAWESAARLTSERGELRDPKVCVTSDKRLMIVAAAAKRAPDEPMHQTLAWFSSDGKAWTPEAPIGPRDQWLWRVTWHAGRAYAVGYGTTPANIGTALYSSADGVNWELVTRFAVEGFSNEATLRVSKDGTMWCLLRRDPRQPSNEGRGLLGRAKAPYREWEWTVLDQRIGGPEFLIDPVPLAVVRLYGDKQRTSLVALEGDHVAELLMLPSSGDSSYAGMVLDNKTLWISYYSSHEGKTAVYLARVNAKEALRKKR